MDRIILLSEQQARKVLQLFLKDKNFIGLEFLEPAQKVDTSISDVNSYRFTSILQTTIIDIANKAILLDGENGLFALYAIIHHPYQTFEIGRTYVRKLLFIRETVEDGMYIYHLISEEKLNENLKGVISSEFKYEFKK